MPMLLFCFFFANDIMIALFGEKYQASKDFLRMYIIRDFLQVFPYFAVLMALGCSRLYMNMHVIGAVCIWSVDFMIVSFFDCAPLLSLVSSLFHVACSITAFVFIYNKAGINLLPKNVWRYVLRILLHCSIILIIMLLVRHFCLRDMNPFMSILSFGIMFYMSIVISGRIVHIDYMDTLKVLMKSRYGK